MSQKYNFYLAVKDLFSGKNIPLLWCSAKTFYEENSIKVDQWNWNNPWFATDYSVDEILDICKENPPNVFGCSVYVWNEPLMLELGKRIKEQHPDCLIVYGGPQVDIKYSDDYFQLYPWVDVVCPSDGYGEIIIKEILDHYPIKDFEDIPYIYYTNKNREKLFSKKTIDKKSFKWANNIYKSQEETLNTVPEFSSAIIETSRGCPYKCIYCDWGGGTYSKISKKPYTTVLDEYEWLVKNKVRAITIADANFGIMPIDVDIAQFIVDCKKEFDQPKILTIETSKNNLSRNKKIVEMLIEAGLLPIFKISVQTIDDEIMKNIERIDVGFDEQVKFSKEIKSKYPKIPIRTETILGLPGDNYQKSLDLIDRLVENDLLFFPYTWLLLPEAPAFSPELREKFKIKTITKTLSVSPMMYKDTVVRDQGVVGHNEIISNNTETVVETYSYTKEDWIDMLCLQSLGTAGTPLGLNLLFRDYFKKEHNINLSKIYDFIFKQFIKPSNFKNADLSKDFKNLNSLLQEWMYDDNSTKIAVDYDPEFPILLSIPQFITFVISLNIKDFYKEVCTELAKKYNDPKIIDLGHYISSGIIDVSYNFDTGRKFKTDYNWLNYFSDNATLTKGEFQFEITDSEITSFERTVVNNHEFDWHLHNDMQRKKQFFYQTMSSRYSSRFSTTIKLI